MGWLESLASGQWVGSVSGVVSGGVTVKVQRSNTNICIHKYKHSCILHKSSIKYILEGVLRTRIAQIPTDK